MRNYKAHWTLVRSVAETFLTSSLSKVIQRIKVTYDMDFIHAKYFHLLHKILSFLTNHSPFYFLFFPEKSLPRKYSEWDVYFHTKFANSISSTKIESSNSSKVSVKRHEWWTRFSNATSSFLRLFKHFCKNRIGNLEFYNMNINLRSFRLNGAWHIFSKYAKKCSKTDSSYFCVWFV